MESALSKGNKMNLIEFWYKLYNKNIKLMSEEDAIVVTDKLFDHLTEKLNKGNNIEQYRIKN